jgi:ABC-type uncharacterized transport system substrate-binding protein
MRSTARGVELQPIEIDRLTDLEGAFTALTNQQTSALVVQDHAFFLANSDAIASLATNHRISSICFPKWAASGGLMGYGVNFPDQFRRAAAFVDTILKGKSRRYPSGTGNKIRDDRQSRDRRAGKSAGEEDPR